MLAVSAQTSVADPVTGVLDAVGTTATQQLDAVAHGATAIPLPPPPAAVTQVAANAAQGVDAVPQAVAGAGDVVRSNASGLAESSRAGDSGGGSGSSNARQPSPPSSSPIAVATRAGRVVASPTPTPTRGEHAAIIAAARRIASPRIDHVTGTLAYAANRAPAASTLAGRASRVAGALLGAVANIAVGARDTLATLPVAAPVAASLLRATPPPNPFALLPAVAGTYGPFSSASTDPSALAANLAAIGSPGAEPSSVAPLGAQPAQQLPTDREASADARGRVHGARETTIAANAAAASAASRTTEGSAAAGPASSRSVPIPSPAGGFAPASSASAGGGISAATFLALAALLLLAAPRALRRRHRAGTSWRLAQFSLIPARPG